MSRVVLIQAQPRDAAGAAQTVRLAGGGTRAYTHLGFTDWRAGIAEEPRFTSALGFDETGWTGGAIPQAAAIAFSPAAAGLVDRLGGLMWPDAPITVWAGDDASGAFAVRLAGTVAGAALAAGTLTLTVTDLSGVLAKPVLSARFAGTGGLEGGADATGRLKRRSWGRVFNVEGQLLDGASNIYEFGDPAQPLDGFVALRDKGAAGPTALLGWAGSAAATLAALKAAAVPAGGGVVAPSIACARWWTVPSGPLTADLLGEIGAGYAESAAAIAAAIVATRSALPVDNAAAIAARGAPAGLHVDGESETIGQALDRLLGGVSLLWTLDPGGTLRIRTWGWDAPAETLASRRVERKAIYRPLKDRVLGYQRNQRVQSAAEIVAAADRLAASAAADAGAALARIVAIESDGVLSIDEKPAAILDWIVITGEAPNLLAQAQAKGFDATKPAASAGNRALADFNAALQALAALLNALAPPWNDTGQDTPIDRVAWDTAWGNYYAAKVRLLVAVDAISATTATWDGVYGTGKDSLIAEAAAAASGASAALSVINIIANAGYLSRDKKPAVIADWSAIYNEAGPLDAQADALGVDHSMLDTARNDLGGMLTSITPAWDDVTQDSAIVPATFRGRFDDYYFAKTSLIAGLANAAAQSIPTVNRVKLSQFEAGTRGWATRYNPAGLAVSGVRSATQDGQAFFGAYFAATAAGQFVSLGTSYDTVYWVPVNGGERLAVSAWISGYGPIANRSIGAFFTDASGNAAGGGVIASNTAAGHYANPDSLVGNFVSVPANATRLVIECGVTSSGAGNLDMTIAKPMVCAVSSAQVALPVFVGGPNGDDGADVTGRNVALDTTLVNGQASSQITDNIAAIGSLANQASQTAGAVQSFTLDVADNNHASPDEKKRYNQLVGQWNSDVPAEVAKAQTFGVATQAIAYQNAWSAFHDFLVNTVRIGDVGTRTSFDRGQFFVLSNAFTAAATALQGALRDRAAKLAQDTTANIFLDPTFSAPTDTTAWSGFDGRIAVQDAGDGRRVAFPPDQGSDMAATTCRVVMHAADRIDIEFEYFVDGGASAVGGEGGHLGIWLNGFDGNGAAIADQHPSVTVTVADARRNIWTKIAGSIYGGALANVAAASLYGQCQPITGGTAYLRNPRGYRVPSSSANLSASGRGTSATLNSTNLIAGIKVVNQTGFALTQSNAGGSVTVNVAALTYTLDTGVVLTYPSGSIPGLAYATTYYFWRNDPGLDGGSSYGLSTSLADACGPGKVYLGYFTTMSSAGSGGGGGGGGIDRCVAADMLVEIEGRGAVPADSVSADERILCLGEDMAGFEFVAIESASVHANLCCEIAAAGGAALELAINTPITRRDGRHVLAANAGQATVPVRRGRTGAPIWERCAVRVIGTRPVVAITCHQRTYLAGRTAAAMIGSHNGASKP